MDDYVVDRIKQTTDLRDLVVRDIGAPMGVSGEDYIWCCPFPDHNEDTPSFKVDRKRYRCFGRCGRHGDIFDWRKEWHKEEFVDALRYLNNGELPPMPSPELARRMAEDRAKKVEEELSKKIEDAKIALDELRRAQAWVKYHDMLDEASARIWEDRGVNIDWVNFWQLGYCPDYQLSKKVDGRWEVYWHSPSLVIPVRDYGWDVVNVKHRLIDEPPDGSRYRQEKCGIPASPFICIPEIDKGPLLLLEGEIKSMVTCLTLDSDRLQIAGLPAVEPEERIFGIFRDHEPIYLCLDPDAYYGKDEKSISPVDRAANLLGRSRVRIIHIPMKIDDAILAGALSGEGIKRLMRMAR